MSSLTGSGVGGVDGVDGDDVVGGVGGVDGYGDDGGDESPRGGVLEYPTGNNPIRLVLTGVFSIK